MAPAVSKMMILGLAASANAFSVQPSAKQSTALFNGPVIGAGGMADTRDPDALDHEDPRKSISVAPSFEEYLKQRQAEMSGGAAPAAAAPAAAAPAAAAPAAAAPAAVAAAPAGGSAIDVLSSLQGPGVVWGADGVEIGKEESELKEYDNFDKFVSLLQSTGVANEIASGEFTIFAPTNSALTTYEMLKGEVTADVLRMQIVPGKLASGDVRGNMQSLNGELTYRYAVRKHFVNDAIIGQKSFGPYPDFPIDVACDNGVIHSVELMFALY